MKDLPAVVLTATIWTYWLCVGFMIVRVRRKTRKQPGVVPRQGLERLMWLVWVPLVAAWLALPYLAATRTAAPWMVPDFAREAPWPALRWAAAVVGVVCLAFPVHPPGRPEKTRLSELDAVAVPTLVVQGISDPFGMPPAAPKRTVVEVRGDHGLKADVGAVRDAVGDWLRREAL